MGRFQKFIAAILLLSFGVPSLCGDGLHLVLGHFHGAHSSSACEKGEDDRTASGSFARLESAEGAEGPSHDADGCPLCRFLSERTSAPEFLDALNLTVPCEPLFVPESTARALFLNTLHSGRSPPTF